MGVLCMSHMLNIFTNSLQKSFYIHSLKTEIIYYVTFITVDKNTIPGQTNYFKMTPVTYTVLSKSWKYNMWDNIIYQIVNYCWHYKGMLTLVTTKTQLSVSDCTLIMSNHLINVIMHLKTYLYVAYKRFFLAFINFISFVQ